MVRAVSKYSLLSISPPQSQFERHNAVELQPITERRTGPLHRRSSVPYICLRRGYLGLRSTTCAPREWFRVLARLRHVGCVAQCPLSGAKRKTSAGRRETGKE